MMVNTKIKGIGLFYLLVLVGVIFGGKIEHSPLHHEQIQTTMTDTQCNIVNLPGAATVPSTFYDHGDTTASEQLILEMLNRARADPWAEGDRLAIDIEEGVSSTVEPEAPLAMNPILLDVSRDYSKNMSDFGFFSHFDLQGNGPWDRVAAYGYPGSWRGETIAQATPSYPDASIYDLWIVSALHREMLLGWASPQNEFGFGTYTGSNKYATTEIGTSSLCTAFLLGVVYSDTDRDNFYDIGEGISGVTLMPDAGDYYTVTAPSGGYAIPITTTGLLTVTISGGTLQSPVTQSLMVDADGNNSKLDFRFSGVDILTNKSWTGYEGSALLLNMSTQIDGSLNEIVSIEWDLDHDGVFELSTSNVPWVSHTWTDDFFGQISLNVTDVLGRSAVGDFNVTILNVAPTVSITSIVPSPPAVINPSVDVQFTGAIDDPGSNDTHTIEWDFGDSSANITGSLTPTHSYASNGTYTVVLRVTDDDGGVDFATIQITVSPPDDGTDDDTTDDTTDDGIGLKISGYPVFLVGIFFGFTVLKLIRKMKHS